MRTITVSAERRAREREIDRAPNKRVSHLGTKHPLDVESKQRLDPETDAISDDDGLDDDDHDDDDGSDDGDDNRSNSSSYNERKHDRKECEGKRSAEVNPECALGLDVDNIA